MNNRNFTIILVIAAAGILIAHFTVHNKNTHSQHVERSESTQAVPENSVDIKNYAYSPQKIRVKKGTTVTWTNDDLVPHTVTIAGNNKKGPDSELFGKGKKYSYTFHEAGVYDYYCKPHPYMKATVEVY